MKLTTPRCPECGKRASGTADMVPAAAEIEFASDLPDEREVELTGKTELFWNGLINLAEYPEKVRLQCEEGHVWDSVFTE